MRPSSCRVDEVLAQAQALARERRKKKLGQHVKYDRHVFANHGIEVQGYAHDTMLQSYVLEVHKPHGLASLAERHLGRSGIELRGPVRQGRAPDPVQPGRRSPRRREYSCEDSDQTLDVHHTLWPQLEADEKLRFVYELEMASRARRSTASSATAC